MTQIHTAFRISTFNGWNKVLVSQLLQVQETFITPLTYLYVLREAQSLLKFVLKSLALPQFYQVPI